MNDWTSKYAPDRISDIDMDVAARVASVQIAATFLRGGMRVLEAGSGTGRLTVQLARTLPIDAIGVDSSAEAIGMSEALLQRERPLAGTARFIQGDLFHLDFPDHSFDLAFSDSVIEHLDDPSAALRELHRVLRPGGVLVVQTPNSWRPDGWDLYRRLANPPYRQDSFSPFALRALARDAGFLVTRGFGEELWLSRNVALLSALIRGDRSRPSGNQRSAHRSPAGNRSRSLRELAKRLVGRALPWWLHINIGVVATKGE